MLKWFVSLEYAGLYQCPCIMIPLYLTYHTLKKKAVCSVRGTVQVMSPSLSDTLSLITCSFHFTPYYAKDLLYIIVTRFVIHYRYIKLIN